MLGGRHTRLDIDASLDDFMPGDVEVLMCQVRALDTFLPALVRMARFGMRFCFLGLSKARECGEYRRGGKEMGVSHGHGL
ncbi:hypothetical protein D3C85_1082410 [compost metagenome]